MIHFRLFGTPELCDDKGVVLHSVLAHAKHAALLAYLARGAGRPHRRERLAALFWPDLDEARARNALSKAVHRLRSALGDDIFVAGGNDTLGSNTSEIWCDVVAFEAAVSDGHHAEALELFRRGELLEGFTLPDIPEFEQWVDQERLQLRRRAVESAGAWGDEGERAGDLAAAADWARVACELAPYDEIVLRHRLKRLQRIGDRAGALSVYRAFAALIMRALEAEPAPETRALAEALHTDRPAAARPTPSDNGSIGGWPSFASAPASSAPLPTTGVEPALLAVGDSGGALSHYRVHESLVRAELSSAPDPAVSLIAERARHFGAAAIRTTSKADKAQRAVAIASNSEAAPPEPIREAGPNGVWKYRGQAILAAAIVGAGVVVALALVARGGRVPESARRVVIAPFENKTGDRQLDPLGAMTADWITDGLSRTGLVSVIDPGTAFFAARDAQERAGSISGNSTAVKAISLATDADIVTTGDYFRKGDSLEFHARVTDARDDRVIASMEPVTVAAATPTAAVEVVRQRVLGILARELDARLSDVIQEQSAPPTFDAYRAYMRGLQIFITREDYESGAVQFRHAYEIDTSFSAALLWASLLYDWEGKTDVARALLDSLLSKRRSLTPLDGYALDAMRADNAKKIDESITAAMSAAAIAPRSQWVWNAAYWSVHANRPHHAIALFESLDPTRGWLKGWNEYYIKLAGAEHMVGDYRGEQETIKRGLQVVPSDGRLQWQRVSNLAAQGHTRDLDSTVNVMLASGTPIDGLRILHLLLELQEHGQSVDADRLSTRAEPVFAKWAGTAGGPEELGELLFMSHRWKDARRQFETARPVQGPGDYQHQDLLYLLGRIGECAAAFGDTAAAIAIADSLGRFSGPDRIDAIFWEASVVARLHRRPEAVALLRQSYALGKSKNDYPGHTRRYRFPDLWGYPPFEEFFKPD
jgi:DNA-binding SARP family transcriptional activator/TolB-like protein